MIGADDGRHEVGADCADEAHEAPEDEPQRDAQRGDERQEGKGHGRLDQPIKSMGCGGGAVEGHEPARGQRRRHMVRPAVGRLAAPEPAGQRHQRQAQQRCQDHADRRPEQARLHGIAGREEAAERQRAGTEPDEPALGQTGLEAGARARDGLGRRPRIGRRRDGRLGLERSRPRRRGVGIGLSGGRRRPGLHQPCHLRLEPGHAAPQTVGPDDGKNGQSGGAEDEQRCEDERSGIEQRGHPPRRPRRPGSPGSTGPGREL